MIRHLAARLPGTGGDLEVTALEGGYSNRTELLRRGPDRWVLRRPPATNIADGAHDVLREAAILDALAWTDVPVPRVVLRSAPDEEPFYVASFVEGVVWRDRATAQRATPDDRWAVGLAVVDMLAAIHRVDPASAGIATRSQRTYVERQLDLWYHHYDASRSLDIPLLDEVHDELVRRQPPAPPTSLVHGDYHLGNLLLCGREIAAVLDWELATVGDPLCDLGLALAYWTEPDDRAGFPETATDAPGFPSRRQLADRYEASSGRAVHDLGFYLAFAHWKVACIAEAVHARVASGVTPAGRAGVEMVRSHPVARARAAARALEQS